MGDIVRAVGTGSSTEIAAQRIDDTGSANTTPGSAPNGNGRPGGIRPGGNGADGNGNGVNAFGVVKSVDGSAVTITARDGSTVTVTASSSTTVTRAESASASDLKVGDQITVVGDQSNGTISATQIRQGDFGGGPPGGGGGGGAPPRQ